MKKLLFFIFILCITLMGCSQVENVKGEYDFKGIITEIGTVGNRILVDDNDTGLIWIILNDNDEIEDYEANQEVVVWVQDTIVKTEPPQAYAVNIEFANPPNQ